MSVADRPISEANPSGNNSPQPGPTCTHQRRNEQKNMAAAALLCSDMLAEN